MEAPHAEASPARKERPAHLLVESQNRADPDAGYRFLRAAGHLVAARTPTMIFLIDDGVNAAVRCRPEVARVLAAGASVWADGASLAERNISTSDLLPGVVAAELDEVTPLLCDPAVQVVWH